MTPPAICAAGAWCDCRYRFTGKERDAESGNDYFGARYYASSMGRWLSPDTDMTLKRILPNPQRWNRYAYVINNPLILVDPNGLWDIYVFRPESTTNGAAWNKVISDAHANGNNIHVLNGRDASRTAYLDALKNGDAKLVFVGHSADHPSTGQAGSVVLTGNQPVGTVDMPVNADGSGGRITALPTPGNIGAESVGAFACSSDALAPQYSSTDFSGLSRYTLDPVAEAGGVAYADVLAKDGTVGDAVSAAQKAINHEQTQWNDAQGKDPGPAPRVKEHVPQ